MILGVATWKARDMFGVHHRHELDAIFGENFSRVDIDKASYTFEGNTYTSWLIEAQK